MRAPTRLAKFCENSGLESMAMGFFENSGLSIFLVNVGLSSVPSGIFLVNMGLSSLSSGSNL